MIIQSGTPNVKFNIWDINNESFPSNQKPSSRESSKIYIRDQQHLQRASNLTKEVLPPAATYEEAQRRNETKKH